MFKFLVATSAVHAGRERMVIEEFQRLVGTRRLQPDDGDAGFGGLPFEQPLFAS